MATNGSNSTTTSSPVKTVGYIGLGNAGFSIASNIPKRGYKLIVHDADSARVQKAIDSWPNTSASEGKAEAFKDCDVIVTMLPQGNVVKEVLLGKEGIAGSLREGTIIIDTSSSSPLSTRTLGSDLASHSPPLVLLDSPITQTYMHATDLGECTLMVGCDSSSAFERAKPVLECMGKWVFHMGSLGSGHAMKTINNYVMASGLCALSDSLVAGSKWGLDPQQVVDVLNVGTGVNFSTLDTFRRDALSRTFNSGFGLALLVKDLGITQEFMQHVDFQTELPGLLRGYLSDALKKVEAGADHTAAIRGWEKRAGVELKKTEKVERIGREEFEHRLKGLNRGLPDS